MPTKAKIMWGVAVVAVIALVAFSVTKSQPDDTIKVGGLFSLTGNGAAYGQPAKNAAVLALEDINKNGGINGKKLEAVYEDTQFDPKVALSGYQSLKARGIRFFLTNGSGVSLAVEKPVVENGDFQFEVGAVTPSFSDGKSNTCRTTLTAPVSGKKLGDFISGTLKAKTFASLTLNDDYGKAMTDAVAKDVSASGVDVIGSEFFDKNASDFRTEIAKLAAAKPDVLLVVPAAGQAEAIFKQLKELNWQGVIVSDNLTIINDNLKDLSLVEGDYFVNYDWVGQVSPSDTASVSAFKNAYLARYGSVAPIIGANAYDSVVLLTKAMAAAGTDNPEAVGAWLSDNVSNYQGVTGTISLNKGCEATRSAVMEQVKSGGFVVAE